MVYDASRPQTVNFLRSAEAALGARDMQESTNIMRDETAARTQLAERAQSSDEAYRAEQIKMQREEIARQIEERARQQDMQESLVDFQNATNIATMFQGEPNEQAFRRGAAALASEGFPIDPNMPFTPEAWDSVRTITDGLVDGLSSVVGQPNPLWAPKPEAEVIQKRGADLGEGYDPSKVYNVDTKSGRITPVGGGGVTVNTGNQIDPRPLTGAPGQGFQRVWDDQAQTWRDMPIPGSEAARLAEAAEAEAASGAEKAANSKSQQRLKLGTTLSSISLNLAEIENGGLPVTGAWGDLRKTWAGRALTGNDAKDFENRTNQVTDSAALDEIQRMRDNSKTGGAVGALTDGERVAIGNAVTAINDATSGEEYSRAAKAYRKLALDLAYGEGNWALEGDGVSVITSANSRAANPSRGISPEAIDLLKRTPTAEYRAFFDDVFGDGAAAEILDQ